MSPKSHQDKRGLPSHIPAWLRVRAQSTGEAYRRWAETSFEDKMAAFLADDTQEEDFDEESDELDQQDVE